MCIRDRIRTVREDLFRIMELNMAAIRAKSAGVEQRADYAMWWLIAVAALCASATSGALGLEKFEFAVAAPAEWDALLLVKLAALGVIFGLVGAVFAFCLRNAKKKAQNRLKNPVLRAFCMGLALSVVLYALYRGRYCGLGTNLINVSLSGETVYAWDWALKLALTVLTLAAGFQGGEVTPLFSIGASLGAVLAGVFGLPVPLCAALGYAAVFGSASNLSLIHI